MEFRVALEFNVERVQGKFASREEIEEKIRETLEDVYVDLDGIGADGDSEYEVVDIVVDIQAPRVRSRS